ncbi:DUF1616 domain-containing protein [Halosimplex pelagicum]|uniref:DUF1616 domain-containing protein n=1 Tax=Halosimplex pelagicum TaxID=869886 RepID=A0A7D5P5B9_9EURY|nr:DUF1616 domain-containing protein [Halosimplex pelagicum]QLH81123.1 DUF1616 domain-containing protein [Halosimplex pelagicum]
MTRRSVLPAVRRSPADLVAVVALTLATALVALVPGSDGTPLRVLLGFPFVLLAPGYALVAAAFPGGRRERASDAEAGTTSDRWDRGLDGPERLAFAVGASVALVPLVGLALSVAAVGLRTVPVVLSLSAVALGATAAAARRRSAVPVDERPVGSVADCVRAARARLPGRSGRSGGAGDSGGRSAGSADPGARSVAVLDVVLVGALVLAVAGGGYAVLGPTGGDYTELSLLTETESGDLVADDYPRNATVGDAERLTLGVGNREGEPVDYTVVVELQRVETADAGARSVANATATPDAASGVTVLERAELRRFTPRVEAGETWRRQHAVTPTLAGERVRLVYLLYAGEAPADPSTANAHRAVWLWLSVSA